MTFSKFVCWHPEMVEQVLDTEALQPTKAMFLATHHPIRMYRAGMVVGASPTEYSEHEFLRDFLAPRDFVFAAVLGEAGTGKSHLIRWLEMNIAANERRKVLLIPKIGTNLKGVIGRILEEMRGPKFDDYRRRLAEGTNAISDAEARERLLDNLAVAVGPNQARHRQLSEMESYLTRYLPDLLRDPVLRRHLLHEGGRVHELVTHVLGRTEKAERAERPKEFTINDLPLNATDLRDASALARNIYAQLFGNEPLLMAAVAWINENLGTALRQLLNLSGESLSELMLDVREALGDQGIELVVLIEDFAKLQGIDRQLLEAFLVRPQQEGRRPLCALRTALALTTGYFDRLEDTVKTRMNFRVLMDVAGVEAGGIVTTDDVERFTSRYLNASRLSPTQLETWLAERGDNLEEVPTSACDGCQHRDACHTAFGEREGYGLYPFNSTAIHRMAQRASPNRFNPRIIINRVLKDTLEKYTDHLRAGQFPPPALQKQFGRSSLTAAVVNELQRRDPVNFGRRQVLIDLWTDGNRVVDLPDGVHEAFALPKLGGETATAVRERREEEPRQEPDPESQAIPAALAAQLKEIDEWHNGGALSQRTAQVLRELVYTATVEHIDWDAELLVKRTFAGKGGTLFQQRYVAFSNRVERERSGTFQLTVPVSPSDLNEAALALQGLLLYQHYSNWAYRGGTAFWRSYARQLESWATCVLDEVRRPTISGTEWDPVPAAVELLTVGARLHGRPGSSDATVADHVEALFADWPRPSDEEQRSRAWRDLAQAFRRRRTDLANIVLHRAAGTKGGSSRVQIIDVTQVRPIIVRLQESWQPREEIPADRRAEFGPLSDLRAKLEESLKIAVEQERLRLLEWDERVANAFGNVARGEVTGAIRELLSEAERAGVAANGRNELATALDDMPSIALDRVRRAIERLRDASNFVAMFAEVGRDYGDVMKSVDTFIALANQFLDRTEQRMMFDRERIKAAGAEGIERVEVDLIQALDALQGDLSAIAPARNE